MTVICPVTGKTCPYNQKLDSGVCPREHDCDVIRAEYSTMLKKPPNPKKYIFIGVGIVLALAIAASLYFFVFDGTLDFLKGNKNKSEVTATPIPTNPGETNTPGQTSTPVQSTEPTPLPAVPVTNIDATSIVRIKVFEKTYEVRSVGLDQARKIQAFPDAQVVSWYSGSYLPGGDGNSILFGFKNYSGVYGAFNLLESIKNGDKISFTFDNGTILELEVYSFEVYPKDNLPSEVFELESTSPRVVLITQAGEIDPLTLDYKDNLVVYLH